MMDETRTRLQRRTIPPAVVLRLVAAFALCAGLNGCVVIGGSSRGGFFLWPGGFGLLFILLLIFLLNRRR